MNEKWKWISIGTVGSLFALSHIGMIGMLAKRESKFPQINVPVGDYTSYNVMAGKDGYSINYKANDPTVMSVNKDIKRKGGFLGLSNNTTKVTEEYVMDGAYHQGGPTSNRRSWQDPATMGGDGEKKISARTIECIEAAGGGRSTGKLVGGSANFTITNPGQAFQFTQTYQGPGMTNQTVIQRVTEVTSVTDTTSIFTQ